MKSIFFLAPDWSPVKNAFRPVSRSTEERRTASLILTPSRLTSAALRASKPLRLGARSPRRALLPDLASQKNKAFFGSAFAQVDDAIAAHKEKSPCGKSIKSEVCA